MLGRLDKYILRQVLTPLFMTLGVAALLLLLERMLRLFDFVVNQGGPVEVVFRLLGSLIPHYLGLALPLGLFLGILLAFRKMSLNSELDAIRSSGIGLTRMIRPVMGLALLMMLINIFLVGFAQPYSRYAYRGLVFDLRSGALGASIKVGEFVSVGDDMILRIDRSHNNGANLEGIFLRKEDKQGRQLAIMAEHGGFFSTSSRQSVVLRLNNGTLVDLNEKQNKPRVLSFDQQDITIELPVIERFRDRGDEFLELTLPELYTFLQTTPQTHPDFNTYRANYHWRLMHSLTFLILPFLAIPLGITNKRTAQSMGMVMGLSMVIVYNELMEVMETFVNSGAASPYGSMWLLFIGFMVMSLRFFYIRAFKVGGEPLAWIIWLWSWLRMPFQWLKQRFERAFE
ncbi:MAG: LPS export ABC transporter permease LptF [Sphingomonadales bacterium]|nr:LPS export ABC transporter permease LptF [Sphingomonadales bacterium]